MTFDENSTSTFEEDLKSAKDANSCIKMYPSNVDDENDYEAAAIAILEDRIDILCCSIKRCWGLYQSFYR